MKQNHELKKRLSQVEMERDALLERIKEIENSNEI
jgi:hypothetical protein